MILRVPQRVSWQRSLILCSDFCSFSAVSKAKKRTDMHTLAYEKVLVDSKIAFLAAVSAVQPARLVNDAVQLNKNLLTVKGTELLLKQPCHVVGFGKAVLEMALSMERILGKFMKLGLVSVPVGTLQKCPIPPDSRIKVLEGAANNLPDKKAEENATQILKMVESLKEDDTLIVLISGGGSALLPLPLPPITLEEKLQVIKLVSNAGADILQLNCVRKRLSSVKGGRLAFAAQPATVVSLILSDVIGDPIDSIASGPTSPDRDSPQAAWDIICKFNLQNSIPESVQQLCHTSTNAKSAEVQHNKVHNVLIGNNSVAINAAAEKMSHLNYSVCILSNRIEGNVAKVAQFYALLASCICEMVTVGSSNSLKKLSSCQPLCLGTLDNIMKAVKDSTHKKGVCLIAGGETTVEVTGHGVGGRNQELALRFAGETKKLGLTHSQMNKFTVSLLSAGTDGIDGPTNAAGAFGFAEQLRGEENYEHYLKENDSHTFYSKLLAGKNLVLTGHTGTNVMDIHILCIQKLEKS